MSLGLGRTFLVQLAASCTNRFAPGGLGGMATNARYLERAGAPRPEAGAAIALNTLAGFVIHVVALAAVTPWVGHLALPGPDLPDRWPYLVTVLVILVALGVTMGSRAVPARATALGGWCSSRWSADSRSSVRSKRTSTN